MKKYYPLFLFLSSLASGSALVRTVSDRQSKMIKSQGSYSFYTHTGPRTDTNICIESILEDRSGNIWVATMGEGVYRYDGKSFTNFTVKDGLLTNLVYCMIEDKDGNIWFGTTGGASRYNGSSFSNFPFSVIKGNSVSSYGTNAAGSQAEAWNQNTEVWSMLQDRSGKIWFGTTDGVYCYDGVRFTSIADLTTSKNSKLYLKAVPSIVEDSAGNIWFTSWWDGLCRFDGTSITSFKPNGERFNKLLLDKKGNFWLGRRSTQGGVYRFDGTTFTKVLSGMAYIWEMKEDKSGNIWFSHGPEGGMIYYNPSTSEIISNFTTKDGLSHNNISGLAMDRSGNIWFGACGMTLTRYDGKAFSIYHSE